MLAIPSSHKFPDPRGALLVNLQQPFDHRRALPQRFVANRQGVDPFAPGLKRLFEHADIAFQKRCLQGDHAGGEHIVADMGRQPVPRQTAGLQMFQGGEQPCPGQNPLTDTDGDFLEIRLLLGAAEFDQGGALFHPFALAHEDPRHAAARHRGNGGFTRNGFNLTDGFGVDFRRHEISRHNGKGERHIAQPHQPHQGWR